MSRVLLRTAAWIFVIALIDARFVGTACAQNPPASKTHSDAKKDAESAAKPESDSSTSASTTDSVESTKKKVEPEFMFKTDDDWRRILTFEQYAVTRHKATEPPFSGKYATGHFRGTFLCVCCSAPVFSSEHKFESGTGWPSFWRAFDAKSLDRAFDNSEAEPRIEVMCRRCGAHLGHVFDDGPAPTGLRFCINSVALKLKLPTGVIESTAPKARSKAKSKTKMFSTSKNSPKASMKAKVAQPSSSP